MRDTIIEFKAAAKVAAIMTLITAAGVCGNIVLAQTDLWQPADTDSYTVLWKAPLWDGETQSRGNISLVEPGHESAHAGAGVSTGPANNLGVTWSVPSLRTERTDLTAYGADEVWFWLKAQTACGVLVTGIAWDCATQTRAASVGTDWTLIRIPIADLDAGNAALTRIDQWSLHAPSRTPIQVDNVWAVRLGPPPVIEEPPVEPPAEETWGQYRPVRVVWESVSSLGNRKQFEQVVEVNLISQTEPEIVP